ncbi:hypothetical protein NFI96_025458, partial [Prochilodus magdalenae]
NVVGGRQGVVDGRWCTVGGGCERWQGVWWTFSKISLATLRIYKHSLELECRSRLCVLKMDRELLLNSLNFSTLLASTVLKLPQIALLAQTKSPKGISVRGLILELSGYIVFTAYEMYHEYPFATYLEYPLLIAQDAVLFLLILHYSGNLRQSLIYSLMYPLNQFYSEGFVGVSQLLTLKSWIIDSAMSLCTFISASSRFAQLQCLWQTKDAGQVSALTWAMSTYICTARILTTVLTSGDLKVLLRFIVMATLNGWVLATVVFYKQNGQKLKEERTSWAAVVCHCWTENSLPTKTILAAASCGQRPVGSVLWAASCGQRPVGSVL